MIEGLKVYRVNDSDCWVTDSLENLRKTYKEEIGEEIDEEELEDCDLDNDGMFWNFSLPEMEIAIKLLIKYAGYNKRDFKLELNGEEYCFSHRDGYGMYVNYRRALELDGAYEKPHLLSTTWY